MPASDILNPSPLSELNPDYSFQKKRPLTHLNQKANRGIPFFRDITDVGHQFVLSWNDRPRAATDTLKQYYEQYRDGFFTFIDHEGGGRQYAGRFSTPVEPVPTAHEHWSVQQVLFDEVPGVAMLQYPNRWLRDAVWQMMVNDFGNVMVYMSGAWSVGSNATAKSGYLAFDPNTGTADFAAYQYYGYGFQFWAPNGPNLGIGQISLDGAGVGNVDFYAAAAASQSQMLLEHAAVPLGIHVVTLTATNTKNPASSGNTIQWDALKVMR